jgi:hypothetical protein
VNETEAREEITEAIFEATVDTRIRSFEEAGVITSNEGFVITFPNGEEFQITIVRSN